MKLSSATSHWKLQRYSALLLIPLTLWFIASVISLNGADYTATAVWANSLATQLLLSLFILLSAIHASLGIEVVCEDYIANPKRQSAIKLAKTLLYSAAFISILAISQINIEIPQP